MLHKQFYVPQNEVSYIFSFFVQIMYIFCSCFFINHVLKFKYQPSWIKVTINPDFHTLGSRYENK